MITTPPQYYERVGSAFKPVDTNGTAERLAHQFRQSTSKSGLPPMAWDSVRDIMRGFVSAMNRILVESDYAVRQEPIYQRMMRRDPDVMSPLFQRLTAIALLDWNIVAEDEEDEAQVKQAETLTTLIKHNMRRRTEFFKQLADACFFGPAAANVLYARVKSAGQSLIAPIGWKPIHSDSIEYTLEGELGMRVSNSYDGEITRGYDGPVHLFDDLERQAIVNHVWNIEGPEYHESREAAYAFRGRGLRDIIYPFWKVKQVGFKYWAVWIQRYALGNRIGYYPSGNDDAKNEMEKALRNLANDVSVLVPREPNVKGGDQYGIELLEANASRAKVFADLVDGYLGGSIKEMLIGQTATTEATATGIGSDVGTRHAETFARIIKYDALALADTLTWEFIRSLHVMNFGETPYYPRFEFATEDVDVEKWLDAVERFVNLGGRVATKLVGNRIGVAEAEDGDEILEAAGGFGGGFGSGFDDPEMGNFARFTKFKRLHDRYAKATAPQE